MKFDNCLVETHHHSPPWLGPDPLLGPCEGSDREGGIRTVPKLIFPKIWVPFTWILHKMRMEKVKKNTKWW